jgi:hypothetical protein
MFSIIARSLPNNEIRVNFFPVKNAGGKLSSPSDFFDENEEKEDAPLLMSDSGAVAPLSLGLNSQTERSRAGFGSLPSRPSRFGLNAVRSLRAHSAALESIAPPFECLFITGTLPGSTEEAFRAIAAYSGYIVHRLKSWIGNYAVQKYDFYVWEYQKRGALHLHYCCHIPDAVSRDFIRRNFKEWWCSVLHRVGSFSNCDMFRKNSQKTHINNHSIVRAEAQIVKKSVGRYLAKYLSKSINPKRGNARFFIPSRWWGSSRPLKRLSDSMSEKIELICSGYHAARRLWESVKHDCGSSDSVTHQYKNRFGEGENIVCYPNSQEEKQCLFQILKSRSIRIMEHFRSEYQIPSKGLKVLKIKQVRLLERLLGVCPSTRTGLINALSASLNWTNGIMMSSSPEPLGILLHWAASLSNICSLCRFSPVWNAQVKREFSEILEGLEFYMDDVAFNGWR